jgi:hypothetical protein
VIEVGSTAETPEGWRCTVRVTEGASQTEHHVNVARADYERLTGQAVSPEELVHKTFEFLLAREPKEAILRQFELSVVSRYFPDFAAALRRQLSE